VKARVVDRRIATLIALLAAMAAAVATAASNRAPREIFAGEVVGVSDGDTLRVLNAGQQVKVRLHGVDCPEQHQDFGMRAKQLTSELAFGKVVEVRIVNRDKYGRTVAEVILPDGRALGSELVRAGLAWWYRHYAPKDEALRALEAEARAAKRGLWSLPDPIAPWDFRAARTRTAPRRDPTPGHRPPDRAAPVRN
jgi:micrococcal nuclease